MARILVTEPVHPDALRLLREADQDVVDAAQLTAAEVEAALDEVEVILVRTRKLAPGGMAPPLRLIAKHGVGVDNI
ncbi:phosphoglycerate dehydrogenase, partial [Thioclava sp. BHET1]